MKALSIQQPWAWLIVNGFKPVENRTWHSNYRGRLLIHTGKKIDHEGLDWVWDNLSVILPDTFETGGIVGVCNMTGCVTVHESPWFFGPYGFVMTDAKPLPLMSLRGQLGFFDVPNDVLKEYYTPLLTA